MVPIALSACVPFARAHATTSLDRAWVGSYLRDGADTHTPTLLGDGKLGGAGDASIGGDNHAAMGARAMCELILALCEERQLCGFTSSDAEPYLRTTGICDAAMQARTTPDGNMRDRSGKSLAILCALVATGTSCACQSYVGL